MDLPDIAHNVAIPTSGKGCPVNLRFIVFFSNLPKRLVEPHPRALRPSEIPCRRLRTTERWVSAFNRGLRCYAKLYPVNRRAVHISPTRKWRRGRRGLIRPTSGTSKTG